MHYIKSIVFLLTSTLIGEACARGINFTHYPKSLQGCLANATRDTGCHEIYDAPLSDLTTCLCSNNNDFFPMVANCSAAIVTNLTQQDHYQISHKHAEVTRKHIEDIWNHLVFDCKKHHTPVQYSVVDFLKLGLGMMSEGDCTEEHKNFLEKWLEDPGVSKRFPFYVFASGMYLGLGGFLLYALLLLAEQGKFAEWSDAWRRWYWNQAG